MMQKDKSSIDRFSYFTFSCFLCSLNDITRVLESIRDKEKERWKLAPCPFEFNLYDTEPISGGRHLKKVYFFTPKANADICVMFSNMQDGWYSLNNVISARLQCDCYLFQIADLDYRNYSMNSFNYIRGGNLVRCVYVMQDPQWVFYEEGIKQWFENEHYYAERIKKKRLNKEILLFYCERLGFKITNPMFWESRQSVLFEERSK